MGRLIGYPFSVLVIYFAYQMMVDPMNPNQSRLSLLGMLIPLAFIITDLLILIKSFKKKDK